MHNKIQNRKLTTWPAHKKLAKGRLRTPRRLVEKRRSIPTKTKCTDFFSTGFDFLSGPTGPGCGGSRPHKEAGQSQINQHEAHSISSSAGSQVTGIWWEGRRLIIQNLSIAPIFSSLSFSAYFYIPRVPKVRLFMGPFLLAPVVKLLP